MTAALPAPASTVTPHHPIAARRVVALLAATGLAAGLAACAAPSGGDGAGAGSTRADTADSAGSAEPRSASPAPAAPGGSDDRLPTQSTRPAGKADWVAVFESPPGTRYADQRVVYVDRASVQPQSLDKLTYFVARTREASPTSSRAKIQELAVLCEGTPAAPATSLRGEGTEDGSGGYSLKRAPGALTSPDQFTTARIRPDPTNPGTFVVRAICLLGLEGNR